MSVLSFGVSGLGLRVIMKFRDASQEMSVPDSAMPDQSCRTRSFNRGQMLPARVLNNFIMLSYSAHLEQCTTRKTNH